MDEPRSRAVKKEPKSEGRMPPVRPLAIWYVLLMIALLWLGQDMFRQAAQRTIPYSEFKASLARGEVSECAIDSDEITGKIARKPGTTASPEARAGERPGGPFLFRTIRIEDSKLVEDLQKSGVEFSGVRPGNLIGFVSAWVLPIGAVIFLWWLLSRQLEASGKTVLGFGKSRARLIAEKQTGVTFNDVAGCDEAKAELVEIVDFLRDARRYEALGAKIPKGVLLLGPPGTGKTLLARAVAGEAAVPFFSLSGSEFVEMFVGVGARGSETCSSRPRPRPPVSCSSTSWTQSAASAASIWARSTTSGSKRLNQLLVEMDGFEPNSGVILLAATNRPDVLDHALLRPGRFDRQVVLDSPDILGREAILKIHAREKPLAAEVDLRRVAQVTPGFSGADLANALNEAALLAARRAIVDHYTARHR